MAGIDASEALGRAARERVPAADLRVGDVEHLPYADASLDAVWGRPECCGLEAAKAAIGRRLPGPGRGAPPPFWRPGVRERLAAHAGLMPVSSFDHTWAIEYVDETALLRSLLSTAPAIIAARASGEPAVRDAIPGAMAPYLTAEGGYRIENEWHYLLARR